MAELPISILIPCFNDGATLAAAVASAEAQRDVEIIVVDDGSTDEQTLAVLDELRTRGVTVLRQENAGPAAARRNALQHARGTFVFPLDADDLLVDGALEVLHRELERDGTACAAWGDVEMFGEVTRRLQPGVRLDPWLQTHLNALPGPALYRKSVLDEFGGWRLTMGYEDWEMWLSLAERGCTGLYVPVLTYRYRIHGTRGWQTHRTRHDSIVAELKRLHPDLFRRRRQNWWRSRAPWRLKLGLPLIDALPLPSRLSIVLRHLLDSPGASVNAALSRRVARLTRR